jgi:hypothetical protein
MKATGRGGVFAIITGALETLRAHNSVGVEDYIYSDQGCTEEFPNPVNYVLQQECDEEEIPLEPVRGRFIHPTETEFKEYKTLMSKMRFTPELLELVAHHEKRIKIDENTIGVHLRLTDMNKQHPQYGIVNYEHYEEAIEAIITPDSNLFLASDNKESIDKFIEVYGDRVSYIPDLMRSETEEDHGHTAWQLDNMSDKNLWLESFLEMLFLSKCHTLVQRVSTLAEAAYTLGSVTHEIKRIMLPLAEETPYNMS